MESTRKCKYVSKALYDVSDLKNFPLKSFFFDLAGQPTTQGLAWHSRSGTHLPPAGSTQKKHVDALLVW
jgi:hypothetical protein